MGSVAATLYSIKCLCAQLLLLDILLLAGLPIGVTLWCVAALFPSCCMDVVWLMPLLPPSHGDFRLCSAYKPSDCLQNPISLTVHQAFCFLDAVRRILLADVAMILLGLFGALSTRQDRAVGDCCARHGRRAPLGPRPYRYIHWTGRLPGRSLVRVSSMIAEHAVFVPGLTAIGRLLLHCCMGPTYVACTGHVAGPVEAAQALVQAHFNAEIVHLAGIPCKASSAVNHGADTLFSSLARCLLSKGNKTLVV